jgi:hypothetical protein
MGLVWAVPIAIAVVATTAAAADLSTARLTLNALGPVRVGMTEEEARRAAAEDLADANRFTGECYLLALPRDPGVVFMIERGRVTRIEITDAHHRTLSGVRVGDTESDAQAAYGNQLEVTPHKYERNWHYLTLRSRDRRYALVMETDGKRITRMRTGIVPSVEYVEGCS